MTRWAVLVTTVGLTDAVFATELDFGSETNHAVSNYETAFAAVPTVNQNQPPLSAAWHRTIDRME